MKTGIKKSLIAAMLAALLLFSALPLAPAIARPETELKHNGSECALSYDNCRSMTEKRFGAQDLKSPAFFKESSPLSRLCFEYFTARERAFCRNTRSEATGFKSLPASAAVIAESEALFPAFASFEERTDTVITDASSAVLYDGEHIITGPDGSVSLFAYEWTFWDYRSCGSSSVDVSGLGVYHKLTFSPVDGEYRLLLDEYDCSDIFGICTMTDRTRDELAEMNYKPSPDGFDISCACPMGLPPSEGGSDGKYVFFDGYDPDAAAEYADSYVFHGADLETSDIWEEYYNSAYYNFNDVGGDCANYVSQSIYAGGMPMVYGSPYTTNSWYYRTGNDRSATWTGASQLREWMGNNRGIRTTATNSTVYKGSPVFYNNAHATICVGRNSAGTPIIDSHNNDRYHVIWNYWTSGTAYTTVQLTSSDSGTPGGSGISLSGYSFPTSITEGSSFHLTGIISSDYELEFVAAGVYGSSGAAILLRNIDPYTTTVNIASEIDPYIRFGELPVGIYAYRIEARDVNGYYCLLHASEFTVTVSGSSDSTDPTRYPIPGENLSSGSSGDGVKWLQACLNQVGYPCAVDGQFGSATAAALRQFQSDFSLSVDGIMGPQVRGKMIELLTCPMPDIGSAHCADGAVVEITCTAGPFTEGCTVYYTADGSTPNRSGIQYGSPFTVSAPCTVRAAACMNCRYSSIAEAAVTVSDDDPELSYTVTFVDWDGTALSIQTVAYGCAAEAPADPERDGYIFTGWDTDFSCITCDLTVTAQYEPNGETVTLLGDVDCNGAVNAVDALLALRYSMGMIALNEQGILNGDMDGDGVMNASDALMILRIAVG